MSPMGGGILRLERKAELRREDNLRLHRRIDSVFEVLDRAEKRAVSAAKKAQGKGPITESVAIGGRVALQRLRRTLHRRGLR